MTNLFNKAEQLIAAENIDPTIFISGLRWWVEMHERLGRLPRRTDFMPEEMPVETLPHVLLIDIGPTPETMRFRLIGTAHVTFNQADHTGKRFSEIYEKNSSSLPYIMGMYAEFVQSRRPILSINMLKHPNTKEILKICRLMTPFCDHDDNVTLCLAVQLNIYADKLNQDSDILWRTTNDPKEIFRCIL